MAPHNPLALLEEGKFFAEFDRLMWDEANPESLLPWLQLVRTDAIQSWAGKNSRAIRSVISGVKQPGEEVLSLLLKRHLLHLDTRRDPADLQRFWDWAAPKFPRVNRIWDRLPDTLNPTLIPGQERAFASEVKTALTARSKAGLLRGFWSRYGKLSSRERFRRLGRWPALCLRSRMPALDIPARAPWLISVCSSGRTALNSSRTNRCSTNLFAGP